MGQFLMWVVQQFREYLFPVVIIYESTRGVKWWKGKVQLRDLDPGLYFYVPYLHKIIPVTSCYQEVDTMIQQFTTTDGVTLSLSANIGYEVWNAALWYTRVHNFDTTVERAIRKIIFAAIYKLTYEEVRDSLPALVETIHEAIQQKVHRWGVRIIEVQFTDFAKTRVIRLLNEPGNVVVNQGA